MMQLRPRVDWEADVLNRYNTLVRETAWNEDGIMGITAFDELSIVCLYWIGVGGMG